jgi:predicted small lipoprotein YifL
MKKVLAVAALLALAACEKKTPAADTAAPAPAASDTTGMQHDSSMARDSAHTM